MSDGTINIDDIKGKVSGISYGSTGSLSADVIHIQGNLTINITNPTPEVIAELKEFHQTTIGTNSTTQKVEETRQTADWLKNLLSKADEKVGTPTHAIRAGNMEISRNELLSKDAATLAYEYIQKGLEWSDKAIQIDPNNAITWYNKGNVLVKLGKYNEAIQSYDRALQISPNNAIILCIKGNALNNLGKYNEAIQSYDRALQINPNFAYAWNNKGNALDKLGKYDEAIQSYDKALEIDPKYAYAWNNKGYALIQLGKNEEGIVCCDKALEIDPKYAYAWNSKGYALDKLGKYDEAIQSYDKVLEIDLKYATAWNSKGHALIKLGKNEEAIVCYDKALEIDPKFAPAWYNKAICKVKKGDIDDGLFDFLKKAIEIDKEKYVKLAKEDNDFQDIRNYTKFKALITSYSEDEGIKKIK